MTTALEAIYLIAHVNSALAFQIRLVLDNQVRHGARHTPHKNAVEVREDPPPRVGHTGRMGLVQLDISRYQSNYFHDKHTYCSCHCWQALLSQAHCWILVVSAVPQLETSNTFPLLREVKRNQGAVVVVTCHC